MHLGGACEPPAIAERASVVGLCTIVGMQEPSDRHPVRGWRRLWRPREPAFWLVLLYNTRSSVLVAVDRIYVL